MPTPNKIIQSVLQPDTYTKFEILRNKTGRSKSNFATYIIEEFIRKYEDEHGEIIIPDQDENSTKVIPPKAVNEQITACRCL